MFETAELRQKISKREFEKREVTLWEDLLNIQRDLQRYGGFPVIIDFAGVRGAGKLSMINLLNKWMDARWIVTQAYDEPTEDEHQRPGYWRFWRDLPPKGQIGLYLSGRYSRPIIDSVYGKIPELEFNSEIDRILAFERTLADDGTLILKFWMHLSRKAQEKRMRVLEKDPLEQWRVTKTDWKNWKRYDEFIAAAEFAITHTSTGFAPWHIVEGQDYYFRSLQVGEIIRDAIANHIRTRELRDKYVEEQSKQLRGRQSIAAPAVSGNDSASDQDERRVVTVLDSLSATKKLSKSSYKKRMKKYTSELHRLQRAALEKNISTVFVFEGPDAAGKGGVIRRMSNGLDALNYKIVPFGAPTAEEQRFHFLWRFWNCLPRAGRMTIFDRSWYGRVLVERVEGFAAEAEWKRAYAEINDFETQLIEHGVVLFKFWIHVTKEEQLKRFNARKETPHKRWKLGSEDWRNRKKWDQYAMAVHDMVQQTSTTSAPWQMIEGNCKLYSRATVMKAVCERLEARIVAQ